MHAVQSPPLWGKCKHAKYYFSTKNAVGAIYFGLCNYEWNSTLHLLWKVQTSQHVHPLIFALRTLTVRGAFHEKSLLPPATWYDYDWGNLNGPLSNFKESANRPRTSILSSLSSPLTVQEVHFTINQWNAPRLCGKTCFPEIGWSSGAEELQGSGILMDCPHHPQWAPHTRMKITRHSKQKQKLSLQLGW